MDEGHRFKGRRLKVQRLLTADYGHISGKEILILGVLGDLAEFLRDLPARRRDEGMSAFNLFKNRFEGTHGEQARQAKELSHGEVLWGKVEGQLVLVHRSEVSGSPDQLPEPEDQPEQPAPERGKDQA